MREGFENALLIDRKELDFFILPLFSSTELGRKNGLFTASEFKCFGDEDSDSKLKVCPLVKIFSSSILVWLETVSMGDLPLCNA